MDDAPQTIGEEIAMALVVQLLRKGAIDEADVDTMAEGLSDDAQHLLNCAIVEAAAPAASDWRAEKARGRFRVVDGGGE